jgi:hypothetical protein
MATVGLHAIGKDKHSSARFGLAGAAVLLASLTCGKVARCFIEPKRAEGMVAYAAGQSRQDPNRVAVCLDSTKAVATALKEKNLFVVTPPREHPVKQIDGILGREVLAGDKWYKVGDKIGDATIVSVASTLVTIEWDGQRKSFAPIAAATDAPAAEPKPEAAKKPKVEVEKPETPAEAKVAQVTVTETVTEEDPLAWMGVELSPKVRAFILEKWNNASEEEREQAKEEWNSMSDDKKQEAIQSMEEHM